MTRLISHADIPGAVDHYEGHPCAICLSDPPTTTAQLAQVRAEAEKKLKALERDRDTWRRKYAEEELKSDHYRQAADTLKKQLDAVMQGQRRPRPRKVAESGGRIRQLVRRMRGER